MCRIVGLKDFRKNIKRDFHEIICSMRDEMAKGGPDGYGSYYDNVYHVALGHRRLAIVDDRDQSLQPMCNERKTLWITFNGEIYNHKEIRSILKKEGMRFKTNSDTEVIIQAYEKWGIDCITRFQGMWAFALWDATAQSMVLCRDRCGEKPLYWYFRDNLFLFASELKALRRHPDFPARLSNQSIALYFRYGYIPAPNTIYEHTHKLEPGTYLILDRHGVCTTHTYWNIAQTFGESRKVDDEREIIEEFKGRFRGSISLRIDTALPVGLFLSGGIDSALIAAIASRDLHKSLQTFSIGFRARGYDEAPSAARIASYLGHEHTSYYCDTSDVESILSRIAVIYDEPFGDPSLIPTIFMVEHARKNVKIALAGDGGDEQFYGYTRYAGIARYLDLVEQHPYLRRFIRHPLAARFTAYIDQLVQHMRLLDKLHRLKSIPDQQHIIQQYDACLAFFQSSELRPEFSVGHAIYRLDDSGDRIREMMKCDLSRYLPDDLLVKIDRASMSVALEVREPFLDQSIIEFSSSLPIYYKRKKCISKYILKKVLAQYLPIYLISKRKNGFVPPLHQWFRGELADYYRYYLDSTYSSDEIISRTYVQTLLSQFFRTREQSRNSLKLWLLFNFQLWKEKWGR